jgi:hypothetical protein
MQHPGKIIDTLQGIVIDHAHINKLRAELIKSKKVEKKDKKKEEKPED